MWFQANTATSKCLRSPLKACGVGSIDVKDK